MPRNAVLSGSLDENEVGVVEREVSPRPVVKLSIQRHLAELSPSNTVNMLRIFDVERARSTVHNCVREADRQSESGRSPDHVAVEETVIHLDDERCWLYAAVDPETKNDCTHASNRRERT